MRRRELLSSIKRGEGRDVYNNYEYVDLQLTGSAANIMWATWNVGATKETEDGNYYKYGYGTKQYSAETNSNHYSGIESPLAFSADTARQVMGGYWRMPTSAECGYLIRQTTSAWTTINGVIGCKLTSKKNTNAYVFFPAAGYYTSGKFEDKNTQIHVWTSKVGSASKAFYLGSYSEAVNIPENPMYCGQSVRGVFKMPSRGTIDGYEYVDLGLSVKWAKCNVGASSETDYGDYFQYGKGASTYQVTSGQSDYTSTTSPLPVKYDTARQVMGGSWRMPTSAQCQELIDNTTYTWENNFNGSGINGMKFTSKVNTNVYVFFPASGYYLSGSLYFKNSDGNVWSSTPNSSSYAYNLYFSSVNKSIGHNYRYCGNSVRGVHA